MYLSWLPVKEAIKIISVAFFLNTIFGNELIRKHGSLSPMLNHKLSKTVFPEKFRSRVQQIMMPQTSLNEFTHKMI
jgi:hypothetical protein